MDELDMDDDRLSFHSKNNSSNNIIYYFEVLSEACFFNNLDPSTHQQVQMKDTINPRSPLDLHDLYIDKLQFFIDTLSMMNEIHINLFT